MEGGWPIQRRNRSNRPLRTIELPLDTPRQASQIVGMGAEADDGNAPALPPAPGPHPAAGAAVNAGAEVPREPTVVPAPLRGKQSEGVLTKEGSAVDLGPPSPDAELLSHIGRIGRTADNPITGFRYQALVVIRSLLTLRPGYRVRVEGSEDLELIAPAEMVAGDGTLTPLLSERVQIKHTIQGDFLWTHKSIYKSVLEFLVQFVENGRDPSITYSVLTPARIGAGPDRFLERWEQHRRDRNFTAEFGFELEEKLHDRIAQPSVSNNLRTTATAALARLAEDQLLAFAAQVTWHGNEENVDAMMHTLIRRLRPLAQPHGLSAEAALHLLISTILYRSTQSEDERILDGAFLETTLRAARDDAPRWQAEVDARPYFTELKSLIEAGIDRISAELAKREKAVRAYMDPRFDKIEARVQEVLEEVVALRRTSEAQQATARTPEIPLSQQGLTPGVQEIVDLITNANFAQAIALLKERSKTTGSDEQGICLYLLTFAIAGMTPPAAAQQAREKLGSLTDHAWQVLVGALADYVAGDRVAKDPLWELTTHTDRQIATTACFLLGEVGLQENDPDEVLRAAGLAMPDKYAVRLSIRAFAEKGEEAKAREMLETYLPVDHPERARLEGALELQLFMQAGRLASTLASDLAERGLRVVTLLTRAIETCPDEANRRRQELLTNRGAIYIWLEDEAAAIADLKKAIEQDGTTPHPHFILAGLFAKAGAIAEAQEHIQKAIGNSKKAYLERLHADSCILLAYLEGVSLGKTEAADRYLPGIVADESLTMSLRERARLTQIRLAVRQGALQVASNYLAEWPATTPSEIRHIAEMLVASEGNRFEDVVRIAESMDRNDIGDRNVVHEGLLYHATALLNLGRAAESAAVANHALDMGMGDMGADLALIALRKARKMEAVADLEQRLLAKNPQDARVWLTRRDSALIEGGNLEEAREAALQLAKITGRFTESLVAARLNWNTGHEMEAAELIRPWIAHLTSVPDLQLAAECAHRSGDDEAALRLAISAHKLNPTENRLTAYLLTVLLRAEHQAAKPDEESLAYVQTQLQQLPDDQGDYLRREHFDVDKVLAQVRAHEMRVRRAYDNHRDQHQSALTLATALGACGSETVLGIMQSQDLWCYFGDVVGISPAEARQFVSEHRTLILDLVSFIYLNRLGLLPALSKKWLLKITVHHLADLRAWRERTVDEVAAAERGHLHHLTSQGVIEQDPAQLREQLALIDRLLRDRDQYCGVLDPKVTSPVPTFSNTLMDGMTMFLAHACHDDEIRVVAEARWHALPMKRVTLNTLLAVCGITNVLTLSAFEKASFQALRLGARQVHLSIRSLWEAYAADGFTMGLTTTDVVRELRHGQWQKDGLYQSLVWFLWSAAWRGFHSTLSVTVVAVAVFNGRSFGKKQRVKYVRKLWLDAVRSRSQVELRKAERFISLVESVVHQVGGGDLFADDDRFPSRRRLHGRREQPPWGFPEPQVADRGHK